MTGARGVSPVSDRVATSMAAGPSSSTAVAEWITGRSATRPDASAIRAHVAERLARVKAYRDPAVWISLVPADQVEAQVARAIAQGLSGEPAPLLGATVAVK